MAEIKKICEELDEIVLEYFHTLDEIYRFQSQLELNMKDGLLLMAKARYSMGHKRVGILQVNEDDLVDAFAKVNVEDSELHKTFQLEREESKPQTRGDGDTGARKRNVGKDDGSDQKKKESNKSGDDNKKPASKNLLKWFGVLVPPVLRQSQTRFKTSIELVCELASQQSKMLTLKDRYRKLLREKNVMLNNELGDEDEEDEEDKLMSLSSSSLSSAEDLTGEVCADDATEEIVGK